MEQGERRALRPDGILETVLYAADLDAIEVFYRDILGLEPYAKSAGRQVFYKCGGQMLLIFNPEATQEQPAPDSAIPIPPHGAFGVGHVCFRATAAAIDQWAERLGDGGVPIIADFQWPGGRGRSIYFHDPAGNCLEFAEPQIWGLA